MSKFSTVFMSALGLCLVNVSINVVGLGDFTEWGIARASRVERSQIQREFEFCLLEKAEFEVGFDVSLIEKKNWYLGQSQTDGFSVPEQKALDFYLSYEGPYLGPPEPEEAQYPVQIETTRVGYEYDGEFNLQGTTVKLTKGGDEDLLVSYFNESGDYLTALHWEQSSNIYFVCDGYDSIKNLGRGQDRTLDYLIAKIRN